MTAPQDDTLYAWVTDTHEDGPSIVGGFIPGMGMVPLCFATERIANRAEVRMIAKQHAKTFVQPVRLVRFRSEGVLERFEP